jgi:hypothetical protein
VAHEDIKGINEGRWECPAAVSGIRHTRYRNDLEGQVWGLQWNEHVDPRNAHEEVRVCRANKHSHVLRVVRDESAEPGSQLLQCVR